MGDMEPLGEEDEGDELPVTIRKPHHGRAVTQELLVKAVEKQTSRAIGAADAAKTLAKLTHLHLNGLRIGAISGMRSMQRLEVLYLYDNLIQVMEGMSTLQNLTHLYLQNNNIAEIDGITGLSNLSKLYLQGNCITHVANLHNLPSLEELHLNGQRLPPGHEGGLTFDMHAMLSISPTLRVLSASGCCIGDEAAATLPPLPALRKLDLSENNMEVPEALEVVMRSAGRLMMAELHGNPFCKGQHQRYRDSIILMSDSLASLDGEEITQQQRAFLLRFQIQKLKNQVHTEQAELAGAAEERHSSGSAQSRSLSRAESSQFTRQPAQAPVLQPMPQPRGTSFKGGKRVDSINRAARVPLGGEFHEGERTVGQPGLDALGLGLAGTRIR